MLAALLFVLGAAAGYGAAFLVYRPRPVPEPEPEPVPSWFLEERNMPPALRRFRVVLSTDSGAEARTLYEKVAPRENSDGLVEFWDGDACRSTKGHTERYDVVRPAD